MMRSETFGEPHQPTKTCLLIPVLRQALSTAGPRQGWRYAAPVTQEPPRQYKMLSADAYPQPSPFKRISRRWFQAERSQASSSGIGEATQTMVSIPSYRFSTPTEQIPRLH